MPNLRLSEADRERLGGPELLPFVFGGITNREAIELSRLGYKTPTMWRAALSADEQGMDAMAWTAAVWLSLRHAGVETDILALEFDMDRLRVIGDPVAEPAEVEPSGKAPARSRSSPKTRSTSGATSSPRSRARSSTS